MKNFEKIRTKKQRRDAGESIPSARHGKWVRQRGGKRKYFGELEGKLKGIV